MLDAENAYFEAHKGELRARYLGKHIVISGNEIRGIYNDPREAYLETIKTMKPGTFMLTPVYATDEEYVQRFRNRVYV